VRALAHVFTNRLVRDPHLDLSWQHHRVRERRDSSPKLFAEKKAEKRGIENRIF
jgi:hypothetical protein